MPPSICSGLFSSIDFGHSISASLHLFGFTYACRLPVVGSVVRGRPRQPATLVDINTEKIPVYVGILLLCRGFTWHAKYMSKQAPRSFDVRQNQWVARAFPLEGVVRDSLKVSDANY